MSALIERAMMLTKPAPSTFKVREELEVIQNMHKSMLGIENASKAKLTDKMAEMEHALRTEKYSERIMPFEPLSWRRKSGLPTLALMSLRTPRFAIAAKMGSRMATMKTWVEPDLPDRLAACYSDVLKMAGSQLWRTHSSVEYSYTFRGVIPGNTKVNIARAIASERFSAFFMLIEVPEDEWQVKRVKGKSRLRELAKNIAVDPIILGWEHERLWVIDKFDTTTLEQYALDEFSLPALGMGSPAA